MNKRLYRSRRDKMIGGVCGGLAEYFIIDPVLMRVLFVVLTIGSGIGLLSYIILWIIVPTKPIFINTENASNINNNEKDNNNFSGEFESTQDYVNQRTNKGNYTTVILAVILILIGTFWLMGNLIPFFTFKIWFPLILITIGIVILLTGRN